MSCWERIIQTKSHEPVKSLGKDIMKLNPKIGLEVPGKNLFVPEKGQGKMIDYLKDTPLQLLHCTSVKVSSRKLKTTKALSCISNASFKCELQLGSDRWH